MAKTSQHNFKLAISDQTRSHEYAWKCEGCDTVVLYDKRLTQHMVNQIMGQRIACLSPREMLKN